MRLVRRIVVAAAVAAVAGCGPGAGGSRTPAQTATTSSGASRSPSPLVHRSELIGRSVRGRPIRVVETGDPSLRGVLVVGSIHGTEPAGIAVTRRLIAARPPARAHVWIVDNVNPDGAAAGSRVNAHGVDLNRNFPSHWLPIGAPGDLQYSGPRPGSEPETRLAMRLVERIRPAVTIWFHQPVDIVRAAGQSVPAARRFARLTGLPFRLLPWLSGSAPNWQNSHFPGAAAFVVELPPGRLSNAAVAANVRAVLALADSAAQSGSSGTVKP